ncbi:MAG TPA: hypothetical protein VJ810_37315 [Blastocatellia bacterium]|nr:hypothetical protein [Blastocatellia bacterium]
MTALVKRTDKQLDRGQERIERILRDGDSAEAHAMMGTIYLTVTDSRRSSRRPNRRSKGGEGGVFDVFGQDAEKATTRRPLDA